MCLSELLWIGSWYFSLLHSFGFGQLFLMWLWPEQMGFLAWNPCAHSVSRSQWLEMKAQVKTVKEVARMGCICTRGVSPVCMCGCRCGCVCMSEKRSERDPVSKYYGHRHGFNMERMDLKCPRIEVQAFDSGPQSVCMWECMWLRGKETVHACMWQKKDLYMCMRGRDGNSMQVQWDLTVSRVGTWPFELGCVCERERGWGGGEIVWVWKIDCKHRNARNLEYIMR